MTRQDEEIAELNATIKTRIGVSPIHGVGVIAIQDIRKGEQCHCLPTKNDARWYKIPWGSLGKLFPEVRQLIIDQWPSIYNGSMFISPNNTTLRILYMNHSDDPNWDKKTDTALRDIAKGEELTETYKDMDNWEKAFPWLK